MELKYDNLVDELTSIVSKQSKKPNKNIIATKLNVFGLYIPKIKELAKKYKDYDFVDFKFNEYYEINFIYAYANLLKLQFDTNKQVDFIINNSSVFECWAIVDSCAPLIKNVSLEIANRFLESNEEFIIRFAYVILLGKVRKHMMIKDAFNIIIKDERYYVMMAEGWLLSECIISNFDESFELLKISNISDKIKFIAIQKALDSFRLNDENKMTLRKYRKFLKGAN